MLHTIESLVTGWKTFRAGGGTSSSTADPVLLAGCYLEWSHGDLPKAIKALEVHASGQYIDMPSFPGVEATRKLLADLRDQA